MMRRMTLAAICLSFVGVGALTLLSHEKVQADDQTGTAAAFEQVRGLVGTWVLVDEDGNLTEEVVSEIKETAGGSAVMEVLFPGTDKEMVTVYYVEGDRLVMTHYCVLGNQPHMQCTHADSEKLVFECIEGSGINCQSEQHMHHGTLHFESEDRMRTAWKMLTDGENNYTAEFQVARIEK